MRCLAVTSFLVFLLASGDCLADARPEVEGPSYASEISAQARARRRAERRGGNKPSENQRAVGTAIDQYLMLTETLLNRGDRVGGETGSRMVILGTTMLDGHPAIELELRPFASGSLDEPVSRRVRSLLVRFAQGVRSGLSRVPTRPTGDPDAIVIDLLQPLREACEEATGREAASGWWDEPCTTPVGATTPPDFSLEDIDEDEIDDALRGKLASMDPGDPLRVSSVALIGTMASHRWMPRASSRAVMAKLQEAMRLVEVSPSEAEEIIGRVDALQFLVDAIGRFAGSPGGRAVAARRTGSMVELLEAWPDQLPPPEPTLAIAGCIDVLAQARAEEDKGLEKLRARIHTVIARQRDAVERRVFDSFKDVARSTSPWTDPGLVVILAEPRHLLEAMRRLRRLDEWLNLADRFGPGRAVALADRMEGLVAAMTDERTREDAARALREFERQIDLFAVMEGESTLDGSRFDPDGRITRDLARARRDWIGDWAAGRSAGDAALKLYWHRRLLEHVRVLGELDRSGLEKLDAWAAWKLPVDWLRIRRVMYQERVEELARAMAEGELEKVARLQNRIEEPYAVLQLAAILLRQAPPGPRERSGLAVLGGLTSQPGSDSLLAEHRGRLAQVGHALLEIQALDRQNREEEAQRLQQWVAGEAMRLLRRMDAIPAAPLAVPGMRDGERGPAGGGMEMMR